MEPWINHAAAFLGDALVKSVLVVAFAALVTACLPRTSASMRHVVWVALFIGLMFLPIFAVVVPRHQVDGWPQIVAQPKDRAQPAAMKVVEPEGNLVARATPTPQEDLSPSGTPQATNVAPATVAPTRPEVAASRAHANPWAIALFALWVAAGLLATNRLVVGQLRLRSIASLGKPICEEDLSEIIPGEKAICSVTVLLGGPRTKGLSPMTWGWLRPVVLLPYEAASWPIQRRRSTLAHEFAHIVRRDWLWQSVAAIVTAVYALNPLVRWAANQMIDESERACDDFVVGHGIPAADYAGDLLDTVRTLRKQQMTGAVSMARAPQIEGRLRSILSKSINRRPASLRAAAFILLGAFFIVLPLSAITRSKDDLANALRHFTPGDSNAKRLANIRTLQEAIHRVGDADPDAGRAHVTLAGEQISAQMYREAAAEYAVASRLPDRQGYIRRQAYEGRLAALANTNDYEATAEYAAQLQQFPDAAELRAEAKREEALYRRLASLQTDGGLSDAVRRYHDYQQKGRKATGPVLSPSDVISLARDLDSAGKHQEAVDVFDDFLKRFPTAPEAAQVSAEREVAIHGLGRVPSAAILNIIARYPSAKNDANMYNNLAVAYDGENNIAKASEAYRKAFEMDPTNSVAPSAGQAYIRTLSTLGRIAERDAATAELLRRFPNSAEAATFRAAMAPKTSSPVPAGTVVPEGWALHAPGNVTVELVKVATAWNGPCWLPDGTPLPHAAKDTNQAFMRDGTNFGILIRVTSPTGTEPNPVSVSHLLPVTAGSWTSFTGDNHRDSHTTTVTYWTGETSVVTLPDRIDLPLTIRCGSWKPAALVPMSAFKSHQATSDGFTLNLDVKPSQGNDPAKRWWTLSDNLGDIEHRITIVDIDGHTIPLLSLSRSYTDTSSTSWFEAPAIPLSHIREFHIETRPYFKALFRDIHLRPNANAPMTAAR